MTVRSWERDCPIAESRNSYRKMAEEKSYRDNYYIWSKIAESDLEEKGCWEAVNPGYLGADGKEIAELDRTQAEKNKRAIAYLFKSVEYYYLEDIGGCKSARQIWVTLEHINTSISILRTLMSFKEMVNTVKKPGEAMQDYLARITALIRKCAKARVNFDDRVKALIYLIGLPKEYEGLTRSLERDEDSLSPTDVRAKLIEEEKRLRRSEQLGEKESDSDGSRAFAARMGAPAWSEGWTRPERFERDAAWPEGWTRHDRFERDPRSGRARPYDARRNSQPPPPQQRLHPCTRQLLHVRPPRIHRTTLRRCSETIGKSGCHCAISWHR